MTSHVAMGYVGDICSTFGMLVLLKELFFLSNGLFIYVRYELFIHEIVPFEVFPFPLEKNEKKKEMKKNEKKRRKNT